MSILISTVAYQFALGGGLPEGEDPGLPDPIIVALTIAFIIGSTYIRWAQIPQQREIMPAFILMIVGIALAESVQLLQIFVVGSEYPTTQRTLMVVSLLAVLQFAPFYAMRFTGDPGTEVT